ncbi:MAG: hypothetical protein R3E89_00645 [Thiolinea sp.]
MSYARLTLLNLGPDNRSLGETIADRFAPLIREQKGFQQVSFFSDVEAGEYGSLTLWESREDAEAAYAASIPQLQQMLEGMLKGPPVIKQYEVYEPKV